ncbi:twin-arginine translocase TatA/TatE family subunit [Blattabacterium sp. (Cryptocercus punctulatus) str. Cpu]|uniref:Sec-independent protein translocase subunit TatA/TatB n=1 Tax=Blattabacterium sp. (Cryptocercus punctulatus) str. Cpu TaxID=1075399 RepID=UPI00023871E3|nr:twin-arginine translocase TatA/TatE family subunit [Blattabacterium sp. (Cryptocercus punctulatus) str. Cpu]AEU09599.1 putative Sec-independent protein translocase [Blattabacterium sp. (Cryptocercus punctulatus) str. Cpu]
MDLFFIFFILLGTFGTTEIVVIVILALLLFGGKKIPELMRGLGTGLKEFKKASENENPTEEK